MVGKVKHVRQKLHQPAVKQDRQGSLTASTGSVLFPITEKPPILEPHNISSPLLHTGRDKQALAGSSFPTDIFAGTKITPEALVQTLKFEETPHTLIPSSKDPEEKKVKSKKEKMKERRVRWLNKISSIKQAKEQQAAAARRQATPVVGDLRPLANALPELCQLINPTPVIASAAYHKGKNKARVPRPGKRPEPTDFSQMKVSKKRKLLEIESSQFIDTVKTLSTKKSPLADIGEQLRKRMKQEEEQDPS